MITCALVLLTIIIIIGLFTIFSVLYRNIRLLPDVLGRGVLVDPTQCVIMWSIVLSICWVTVYRLTGT